MRALDRLSASSFIVTAPTPANAEPSRRIANLLEIAGVDIVEAGVAGGDHREVAARADDRARDLGAQIAARFDDELTLAGVTRVTPGTLPTASARPFPWASTRITCEPPSTSLRRSSTRPISPILPRLNSATRSQIDCT